MFQDHVPHQLYTAYVEQTLARHASPFMTCLAWKQPSPKSHLIHFLLAFVQIHLLKRHVQTILLKAPAPAGTAAAASYPEIFFLAPPN